MQNKISIPVGTADFKEIRKSGDYYVDKTFLISNIINDSARAILFTRPRRFGKTTAQTMLKYFFDVREDNKEIFDGLSIMNDEVAVTEWMNKYPVMFLSLKDVDGLDFESALSILVGNIYNLFSSYSFLSKDKDLDVGDRVFFLKILSGNFGKLEVRRSLSVLAKILHKHYKKEVILLIDEYDVPLDKAEKNGYYREMMDVLRVMFSSVMKDNSDVKKSILTGCLRISKESLFTGLNNLGIYSITNKQYATSFGFTEEEVSALLNAAGLSEKKDTIKEWYDGYNIGGFSMYAPWDVLSYVKDLLVDESALPDNYWANTSGNDIIRRLIDVTNASISEDYTTLINGGCIDKNISENLTYSDLYLDEENIWSLMLSTGYVTLAEPLKVRGEVKLRIPNEEIRLLFKTEVNKWFSDRVRKEDLSPLFDAIWNADVDNMTEILNYHLRRSISYFDSKESFYHAFMLGLFSARGYSVKSNMETGDGRPDIILNDTINLRCAIFELKSVSRKEDIEKKEEEAKKQILEKSYGKDFDSHIRVLCYSIVFYKKTAEVMLVKKNY